MQKYWLIFKISIQRHLEYRFNLFMSMGKYTATNVFMALVWIAVGKESQHAALSVSNMVLYFTFVAVVYRLSNFHTDQFEEDVRLGYLSRFLLKPLSPFWYYFSYIAGAVTIETIVSAVFLIPLFIIFFEYLSISLVSLALSILFLPVVFIFSFLFLFTLSSFTFWFQEVAAIRWAWFGFQRFASGIWVPLYLFPLAFQKISFYLPFQHLAYTPVMILQSQIDLITIGKSLLVLLAWIFLIVIVKNYVWKKGLIAYEATGA